MRFHEFLLDNQEFQCFEVYRPPARQSQLYDSICMYYTLYMQQQESPATSIDLTFSKPYKIFRAFKNNNLRLKPATQYVWTRVILL